MFPRTYQSNNGSIPFGLKNGPLAASQLAPFSHPARSKPIKSKAPLGTASGPN